MLKTWADIQRAALTDPFLYRAVILVDRGDLTREEALIQVALALSVVRAQMHEQIVTLLEHSTVPPRRMPDFLPYLTKK